FTLAGVLLFPNGATTSDDEQRPEVAADALAYSRVALALRQKSPWTHVMLGAALNLHGNLAEAETAFRKAIDLKPDFEVAYLDLGNVLSSQGKLAEAIDAISK